MAEITREQVVLALASGATPRLSGINLSGLNLSGLNLRYADLRNSSLTEADLSHADLRQADLCGANLTRANLQAADLSQVAQKGLLGRYEKTHLVRAILNEADLRSANLEGAVFDGASLVKADLRGARVSSAHFEGADLTAADLREVLVEGLWPSFSRATLRDANLSGLTLPAIFKGADLTGVNLSGANLRGSFLNDFKLLTPNQDLVPESSACLRNANLTGADLTDVDLRGVDLTGANLSGTKVLYCPGCGTPGIPLSVRKGTFWTGHTVHECPACGVPWADTTGLGRPEKADISERPRRPSPEHLSEVLWDVIVDRIPGERERGMLRAMLHRSHPHLNAADIEGMLTTPMTVGSAMSLDAANALMRQLEGIGVVTRKRRVGKEATAEPTESVQHASSPRYCARCGAVLVQDERFCTRCGGQVHGLEALPTSPVPVATAPQRKRSPTTRVAMLLTLMALLWIVILVISPPLTTQPPRSNKSDVSPSESTSTPSGTKRAKGGLGCFTKAALSRAMDFIVAKDEVAGRKLLETGQCIAVRPGASVFVEEVSIPDAMVRIRAPGDLRGVWVPIEMVE